MLFKYYVKGFSAVFLIGSLSTIGFSETVIYSGENRSIDIGYLNPMSSHLEIELNNHSKDGWALDSFELGHYGYSAIITLKK